MGKEIDLLRNYPRTKRDPSARGATKTPEDQALAREFGRDFFDGDRRVGYGGFKYDRRFWMSVVPDFMAQYPGVESILDVGCAKGFMIHDFKATHPWLDVRGVDISEYAIANCIDGVKRWVSVGSADQLQYPTDEFDLVISINTIHNLPLDRCEIALREIERVKRKYAYVTVDAYRNDEEKQRMMDWNLTAQTILHVDEWRELFDRVGYTGDYGWFIP